MAYMSNAVNRLGVIVVAAGRSSRMGGVDKQLLRLGGIPVILHSLRAFESFSSTSSIVLVMSEDNFAAGINVVEESGLSKIVDVVVGGERRQDSVKIGLDVLASNVNEIPEFVAVHDGARPFVDHELIERGMSTARAIGAGIAAVPVKDTIKVAPHKIITDTLDRSELWAIQTPQIFRYDVLNTAHDVVRDDVTDDASMVESSGGIVATFSGSDENIKITTPEDLHLASLILEQRLGQSSLSGSGPSGSIFGIGFDGHRLVVGGPLRLGGVDIDFGYHLDGHSDGDVLLHSIASAILGAANLGDLGGQFPSSDERYINFDSTKFIAESARKALLDGWLVEHVDATIIAQRPKLAAEALSMAAKIGEIDGLDNSTINIKITSTDSVGSIGAGEGIAAQAIATLIPIKE
ncbi:MAG: bifunctional 2-C-methyl-D-erythritol 4-phosphate cytidylyltransferase/2-C-methyl-D-erythritol 2,4-cyclodiphosphate synthase [Chloroflexi bacterium]|nr:bifunctional 2-C-methyl-D-erythritol 4-phosphate cytidylyltransferase/2-C-methyl-D-erythritol 2,4-cyclodiphosphate synthase [Chloroflexota bacterium]